MLSRIQDSGGAQPPPWGAPICKWGVPLAAPIHGSACGPCINVALRVRFGSRSGPCVAGLPRACGLAFQSRSPNSVLRFWGLRLWDHAAAFPSSSGVVPLGCQVRLGALHPSRPGGLAVLDCLSSTRILRYGCALSACFRARRRLPRTVAAVLPLGLPVGLRFGRRLRH